MSANYQHYFTPSLKIRTLLIYQGLISHTGCITNVITIADF